MVCLQPGCVCAPGVSPGHSSVCDLHDMKPHGRWGHAPLAGVSGGQGGAVRITVMRPLGLAWRLGPRAHVRMLCLHLPHVSIRWGLTPAPLCQGPGSENPRVHFSSFQREMERKLGFIEFLKKNQCSSHPYTGNI